MKFIDLLKEIFWSIRGNKARSGLTILGIVIGIGSVIAMISIGQGAKTSIQTSIESIGSNLIMVMPGFIRNQMVSGGRGSAQTLTLADAEAIKNISNVKWVAPSVSNHYQITAKTANTNTQTTGATAEYTLVRNLEMENGQFFTDSQNKEAAKTAVLGSAVRDDLFGENSNPIGQTIKIKNTTFKIIGIVKSKGGSGFTNTDDMIYVPLTTAQRLLIGNNYLNNISITAKDQNSMALVQEEITTLLLTRHNITDAALADFNVMNQVDIASSAASITNTLTLLLASIAGISLLVGGIGIMNMMLTTVTERTREIGLRKSIGAKKKDITIQFLTEAIVLTFLGGFIGIIFGYLISLAINKIAGLATTVSIFSILLAFAVSAAVGIIFGYYPARRAASLNPIEALRYE